MVSWSIGGRPLASCRWLPSFVACQGLLRREREMEDQTLDTGLNVRVAVSSTTPAQSLREAAAAARYACTHALSLSACSWTRICSLISDPSRPPLATSSSTFQATYIVHMYTSRQTEPPKLTITSRRHAPQYPLHRLLVAGSALSPPLITQMKSCYM